MASVIMVSITLKNSLTNFTPSVAQEEITPSVVTVFNEQCKGSFPIIAKTNPQACCSENFQPVTISESELAFQGRIQDFEKGVKL
jgi:hypothetical protein